MLSEQEVASAVEARGAAVEQVHRAVVVAGDTAPHLAVDADGQVVVAVVVEVADGQCMAEAVPVLGSVVDAVRPLAQLGGLVPAAAPAAGADDDPASAGIGGRNREVRLAVVVEIPGRDRYAEPVAVESGDTVPEVAARSDRFVGLPQSRC